jgi:small-conductance mechanosensitive channel
MSHFIPTAEYYAAGYKNLSSGDCFRVAVRFGIDYAHQRLDTAMVCDKFKAGLEENFSSAPFKDHVRKVDVEFDEAADSSLNYVMFALFETEAARHRNRIGRRIQAACVAVCNDQGWGIPFPQLTVHHPDDAGVEGES